MDIGKPQRIITVEPEPLQVPREAPAVPPEHATPAPAPAPVPEPARR